MFLLIRLYDAENKEMQLKAAAEEEALIVSKSVAKAERKEAILQKQKEALKRRESFHLLHRSKK